MNMLKGQRILVIEDEPTIALDIKYVLIDGWCPSHRPPQHREPRRRAGRYAWTVGSYR